VPSDRQEPSASDPLAELARLIGQTDPFADLRRQARVTRQQQGRGGDEQPQWDHANHAGAHDVEADHRAQSRHAPAASYYAEPEEAVHENAYEQHSRRYYSENDTDIPVSRYGETHDALPSVEDSTYEQPRGETAYAPASFHAAAAPVERSSRSERSERHYDSPGVQPELEAGFDAQAGELPRGRSGLQNGGFYPDEEFAADEQDFYADEQAPRHRKLWITAAAVCALAVVGSASAFGYRTIFGKGTSSAPPPVITANASPIKVVPAQAAADPQAGKINYDRFGDKGQGEKVVVREEQPVDVNAMKAEPAASNPATAQSLASPGSPSAQLLATTSPATTAAIPPVAPPPPAPAIASSMPSEPKKVRTVTIKPDQPSGLDSLSARSAAVQAPGSRSTAAPPAANTPAAAPMRTASAPANVKPTSEPSIAGGFMVQVSSQKSEADAKASYKTLQAKFPTQLQNRSAVIRKADVSGKGTFYRAQVGPFNSSDQANEFCSNLKAAGGQCVVQRN
jgi:hypothetical protein